jgi:hypothetical protein
MTQLPIDGVDPVDGTCEIALRRSVAAGRKSGLITSRDDAAVAAAAAVAHSLDTAISYGATLDVVVKGTTALRAYLAALNLTPASRDEDGYVNVDTDPSPAPDWLDGAAKVPDTADTGPA